VASRISYPGIDNIRASQRSSDLCDETGSSHGFHDRERGIDYADNYHRGEATAFVDVVPRGFAAGLDRVKGEDLIAKVEAFGKNMAFIMAAICGFPFDSLD
jgi:hypothetical protein